MIPDEAVDVAVKIIYGDAQEGVTAEFQSFIRARVRAALEAAAPHMAAAAWDEGYEGAVDAYDGRNVSNPYREEPNGDD